MRERGQELSIGERVAWYRARRGLSQEVLAGLVGRTTDWLSKIENGRANLERLSVIKALADALDVTVADLLGEPSMIQWTRGTSQQALAQLRGSLMSYTALTTSFSGVEQQRNDQWRQRRRSSAADRCLLAADGGWREAGEGTGHRMRTSTVPG